MRTLLVMALVVCVETLSMAADTPTLKADRKPEAERALLQVERDWNEAFKNRNETALTAMCAADFQFTDDQGEVGDKARYLENAAKQVKVLSYTLSGMTARIYGDTGIVVGQWTGTTDAQNDEIPLSFRFTDTFVRREGRWWAVASQMTRITQPR